MITVMARSLSGRSPRTQAKLHTISLSVLSRANVVLEHGPGLAEQVRIGALRLDAAYDEVCRRKAQAAAVTAQYDNLLRHAPDLAAQVAEELLTLDEATTKLGRRLEEDRLRQRVKEIDAVRQADGDTTPAHTYLAEQGEITWQQAHQLAEQHHTQRQESIHRTQQAIEQISANWTAIQNVSARPDTPYTREILEGLTPEAHTLIQGLTAQA
ncbi:hypothetical protein OTB20_12680 [Streptomyces sp. H27-H1]|uniref:hypothetical protein n=1 Tax=Streptomyces sp. H27-H1 TaxID=2996461 RepID=UPI0022713F6F|nr:hypothetical protein [Streptomyces sp. H27-H1]MCY0927041.1 hypothetical protein [Streptomyces sp. H27-H1]